MERQLQPPVTCQDESGNARQDPRAHHRCCARQHLPHWRWLMAAHQHLKRHQLYHLVARCLDLMSHSPAQSLRQVPAEVRDPQYPQSHPPADQLFAAGCTRSGWLCSPVAHCQVDSIGWQDMSSAAVAFLRHALGQRAQRWNALARSPAQGKGPWGCGQERARPCAWPCPLHRLRVLG